MGVRRTRDQNRYRAIPRIKGQTADVRALVEVVEVLVGARSDPLYRALTLADLLDEGIVAAFGDGFFVPRPDNTNPNPGGGGTVEAPGVPTNFTAAGTFTAVAMTWDLPAYNGHAYTSIYRAATDNFALAVEIQTVLGRYATDVIDPGSQYYYWIRFVNVLGNAGPLNASAGTLAATEIPVSDIIQAMDDLLTLDDLAESLQDEIAVGRAVETYLYDNWSIETAVDTGDNVRVSGMKLIGGESLSKIIFNTDVFAVAPPFEPGQSEPGEPVFVIGPWTDPLHPDDPPIQRVVLRDAVIGDLTVGEAAIQSLRADKITIAGIPGDPSSIAEVIIGIGDITTAQIGNYIQSDNFDPLLSQGWRLTKGPFPTSSFEIFGSIVVRDTSGNLILDAGGNAYGAAIANSAQQWTDVNGRPADLSEFDEMAAAKLLGIDFNATRNNIYVRTSAPTEGIDGPFYTGDIWWNNVAGKLHKWSGAAWQVMTSQQWVDIYGRPSDLSELDEIAATKLLGIPFDATRNNIYVRSSAPTVVPDGPFVAGDLWWDTITGRMYRWDTGTTAWSLMSSRQWVDIIARPETLDELDEVAAAKLLGIDFDATRNNIFVRSTAPTVVPDGPFYPGDLWWNNVAGKVAKWSGTAWETMSSQQWVDIYGRPSDLSELDEVAATKLLGIPFDATRNNIYVRATAPTVVSDGPFVNGDLWWESVTGKMYRWDTTGNAWQLMASRYWVDILNRPETLDDFDETAAAKLFGIDFEATRNNIYSMTTTPNAGVDGPFVEGDLWWKYDTGHLYKWNGVSAWVLLVSRQYVDLYGRPSDLSEIDEAAATKLLGIPFDATRNNIYVRITAPTVEADGPFVSGDLWWDSATGKFYKWGGSSWQLLASRQWLDIVGRPSDLSEFDETAAAKLFGIDFNATRNNLFTRTSAPIVGVDGPFVDGDLWWNPTAAKLYKWDDASGWVMMTSRQWVDINGRPSDLSELDEAAATKLLGIPFDATRNNIYVRTSAPTVVPDGPFYTGDLWWNSATGKLYKWQGVDGWSLMSSRQWIDITGRPEDLSELDEAAAAKLLGIEFDATRNNIYDRPTAPLVGVDGPFFEGDLWWEAGTGRLYKWDDITEWTLMSSRQYTDVYGRPSDLSELDEIAATKLVGIDFNATRNNIFTATTAPEWDPENPFFDGDIWWNTATGKMHKWVGTYGVGYYGWAVMATSNNFYQTNTMPPGTGYTDGDLWWHPAQGKLYKWNVLAGWQFVADDVLSHFTGVGGINPTNIGTYIANAAVGTLYLQDTVLIVPIMAEGFNMTLVYPPNWKILCQANLWVPNIGQATQSVALQWFMRPIPQDNVADRYWIQIWRERAGVAKAVIYEAYTSNMDEWQSGVLADFPAKGYVWTYSLVAQNQSGYQVNVIQEAKMLLSVIKR